MSNFTKIYGYIVVIFIIILSIIVKCNEKDLDKKPTEILQDTCKKDTCNKPIIDTILKK